MILVRNHLQSVGLAVAITMAVCLGLGGLSHAESQLPPKQHDLSYAVSSNWVLAKLNQNPKPVLVDVRNPEDFEKLRIPESINLPLHAIKTKPFLRNRLIILVNQGYLYSGLADEAGKLKEQGFSVSILYGGLMAWQKNKGELMGDRFEIHRIRAVSPSELYQERMSAHHRIVDISQQNQLDEKNVPKNRTFLSPEELPSYLSKDLSDLGKASNEKTHEFVTVLIVSKNGNDFDKIEPIVENAKISNVFFLKGGWMAYEQYLNDLKLAMAPKQDRMVTKNACDTCEE